MVFKNGFKEFFAMGMVYGIVLGLYFGLTKNNPLLGLTIGILSGTLFGGLLYSFLHYVEKEIEPIRREISREHKIICDGVATYKNINGWLFFTDDGLEFHPRKLKHIKHILCLPNTNLKATRLHNNKLVVYTHDDKVYEITVVKNNEWKNQIDGFFKNHSENS